MRSAAALRACPLGICGKGLRDTMLVHTAAAAMPRVETTACVLRIAAGCGHLQHARVAWHALRCLTKAGPPRQDHACV